MFALMVALFVAWTPEVAHASCGDYLHHRFGIGQNEVASSSNFGSIGLHNSRELTRNRSVTPVPAQKRCYSCRGATVPVSVPVVPAQERVEYLATISDVDEDCATTSISNLVGNEVPSISEGAYPSLLRPPIA